MIESLTAVDLVRERGGARRRARAAWCWFDFANSPFPTLAITAFGAPYFASVLAGGDRESGLGAASAWGISMAAAMLLAAVTSPVVGAALDRGLSKRKTLAVYVWVCVAATTGLGFVQPGQLGWAMGLYILATFALEGAYVCYNAYLPELAVTKIGPTHGDSANGDFGGTDSGSQGSKADNDVGRLSGRAWALGYAGGLLALGLCFPLLPQDYNAAGAVAASRIYWVVAAWYGIFSLPALIWLPEPDPQRPGATTARSMGHRQSFFGLMRDAFGHLGHTLGTVRSLPVLALFLAAFFLYSDAIATVIEFIGVFTKEVLAFGPSDNVVLFLILNVVAIPGTLMFGVLTDRLGGVPTLRITLVLWTVVAVAGAFVQGRAMFWGVAMLAATVIGAAQATSRAVMAQLAPEGRTGEFMGLLAFSGKASAVLGPVLYGVMADSFSTGEDHSLGHRLAMGLLGLLFVVAWMVLGRLQRLQANP